jgi:glyoxylase-like metal-dependent hydrolase (beta-lactamase superfamily II)
MDAEQRLQRERGILRVRAENPGPLTLSGTNTWIVGRSPAYLIDPGPLLEEHLARVGQALEDRGGLGGIALTHDHHDHGEAVAWLRERYGAPLAAARGDVDVELADGVRFGPLEAFATPGHSPDHFALLAGGACFSGDAVLGEGSVFITPYPGAMSAYLEALERLRRREDLDVICPGHGPPVSDVGAKLDEYIEHRRERERALIAALDDGKRTTGELLSAAWPEVPAQMHPFASATLAAHLDRLAERGPLPAGVQRPQLEGLLA